ncbi:MAG: hypothetical protein UW40_C0047G0026 [Parcubacteria group bacterium GW2011_GWF2_44_17]|nr:MAG: hypothetical protein UW40_C0047G0026 [Parcubacteria group bacterium GW2011_GWF2_44_17]
MERDFYKRQFPIEPLPNPDCNMFRSRIFKAIVQVRVIKLGHHFTLNRLFYNVKIYDHAVGLYRALYGNGKFIVVSVQIFTLAAVFGEKVSGGKAKGA